jgi:hypothetical protein
MIHKSEIFVNKSYWESFNGNQLNDFAEKIFQYYRSTGFPYYKLTKEEKESELQKLMNYDISGIIKDGVVQQTMHGLGLAWSYFPHSFEVKCLNKLSPLEAFNDDEIFRKVIKKRLKFGTYISDSGILKMLKMYSSVQAVSNFRPTAAAALYEKYAPNGVVWDMSGGWGGRMLGAYRAKVKHYHATEPAGLTYLGLSKLSFDLKMSNATISRSGSEEYLPIKNSLDFCFTSPPYFDLEKYSNEESQSYVKFKKKNEWVEGFLRKTFENCYYGLKNGGHMGINIADPKKKNNISLESETIRVAKEIGFKHTETLKLALSNPNMLNRTSAFKYEPIFIFKK